MSSNYEKNLVSVIIPTYKRTDMLERAIESVLHQTYSNIELLLVNDNIPDDDYSRQLKDKVLKYKGDPRFHLLLQEKHINGAVARNFGIKHSKGEYIAFLDDDDWWEPNKLEVQVSTLASLDDTWGGVSCKFSLYDASGNVIAKTRKYKDGYIYKEILYMYTEVATGTILLRHSALDDAGYFDENLLRSQDIQLLTQFAFKYKIMEVDEYLHCADCSDNQNRKFLVDENKNISIMNAYMKSVSNVISTLSADEVKCAYSMRYFSLGYLLLKEGKYVRGLKYILSIFSNWLSLKMSIKLIYKKRLEKKF